MVATRSGGNAQRELRTRVLVAIGIDGFLVYSDGYDRLVCNINARNTTSLDRVWAAVAILYVYIEDETFRYTYQRYIETCT